MTEPMTGEECRSSQRECSRRVDDRIDTLRREVFAETVSLRREVKEDISLIRDAQQSIDRAVASIKGHLGINGQPVDPHRHQREREEQEHLHRRMTDFLDKQDSAPAKDGVTLPRWAVIGIAGFITAMLALAMVAGERGLWTVAGK